MKDSYLTISKATEGLLKEKASKFYAYAFPVKTIEDVQARLDEVKKDHIKARHFCYAYIIGIEKDNFRANDDGEPSGTAGRPILGQIEKLDLTDTFVVVVRYFGGTKLGTSGLISAYKGAASLALEANEVIEEYLFSQFTIGTNYELIGNIMNIVSNFQLNIKGSNYEEDVELLIEVRASELDITIKKIKAKLLNRSLADIMDDTIVEDVTFKINESEG